MTPRGPASAGAGSSSAGAGGNVKASAAAKRARQRGADYRGGRAELDEVRPESKSARARRVGAQDRLYRDAYNAGKAGDPLDDVEGASDPDVTAAWQSGRDAARQSGQEQTNAAFAKSANAPFAAAARRSPLPLAGDAPGFLLGMILYALAFNWIAGGPAQVRRWLAAKFLNRVGTSPSGPVNPNSTKPDTTNVNPVPPGIFPGSHEVTA